MSEQQGTFEGWAIVEVLGHRRFAGLVKQLQMGTQAMLRVDVPEVTVDKQVWDQDVGYGMVNTTLPAWNTFVSPASLYQLTPCPEEFAREKAKEFAVVPPGFVLPKPEMKALTMQTEGEDGPPF